MAKPVLEGIGIGPALDFSELNKAFVNQRRDRMEREQMKLQQQQKAEQRKANTANFLKTYVKQDDFNNTGTIYDGKIGVDTQEVINKGAQLIAQGADEAQLMLTLGPEIAKIADYSKKAKFINTNIQESAKRLKEQDKGYNYDELVKAAQEQAFTDIDPKTGERVRKGVDKIDDQQDYVTAAIKNQPGRVSTFAALDQLIEDSPMESYSREVQTSHMGKQQMKKYKAKHPFYMDLERNPDGTPVTDDAGNPKGLAVRGGVVYGDDKKTPLINPLTKQPYMGLEEKAFDAIVGARGSVKDRLRAEVQDAFSAVPEAERPKEGSPQWNAMARSIMHEELTQRKRSEFDVIDRDRESALAQKLAVAKDQGALELIDRFTDYASKDTAPKTQKDNVVDSFVKIMTNDPESTQGEVVDVGGRKVVDVTGAFPGGRLKAAQGSGEKFNNVYYDKAKKTFIFQKSAGTGFNKRDFTEEVPFKDMPKFVARYARANGVELSAVKKGFAEAGFDFTKGDFSKSADNPELDQRLSQATEPPPDTEKKVKSFLSEGGVEKLKGFAGTTVGGNVIKKVARNRGWNDKYYDVTYQTPEGKLKTEGFKTKQDVVDFLQGKSGGKKIPLPAGKPRTVKQGGNTYTWNEATGKYE